MKVKIDTALGALLEKMACAYATTTDEALKALWEADEIVVVNGLARLIVPSEPDGRIAR